VGRVPRTHFQKGATYTLPHLASHLSRRENAWHPCGLQAVAQALQVVGYLLMHTRQLDVIMADRAAFAHYGEKIRADLAQFK